MSRTFGFRIRGEGEETLEIDVYDVIGESFWGDAVSAKDVRRALKGSKASTVKLRVNSGGGDVFEGFAIYSLLAELEAHVVAEIDGLAASMASVIVMAADEIKIAKSAMMMVHNPWGFAMGEADDLRGTADLLDKMRGQIADAYVARTELDRDEVLALMDAETWMTADEALEKGFVDAVKPTKKKSEEKALAALSLHGFERAPALFAMAIKRARAASNEETNAMTDEEKLAEIRKTLGLAEDASIDEICAECRKLGGEETPDEEAPAEEGDADANALRAELEQSKAALREALEQRDAARAQLAQHADAEIRALVDGAIARDQSLGPKRATLETLAKNDRELFAQLYGSAAPTPILTPITTPGTRGKRGGELSDREQLHFRSLKAARVRGPSGKLATDEELRAMAREKAAEASH